MHPHIILAGARARQAADNITRLANEALRVASEALGYAAVAANAAADADARRQELEVDLELAYQDGDFVRARYAALEQQQASESDKINSMTLIALKKRRNRCNLSSSEDERLHAMDVF